MISENMSADRFSHNVLMIQHSSNATMQWRRSGLGCTILLLNTVCAYSSFQVLTNYKLMI